MSVDFVPFAAKWPDAADGRVIDVAIANDAYLEELAEALTTDPFGEAFASETLAPALADPADELIDGDEICVAAQDLTLVVGFPFAGQYAARVTAPTAAGFTRAELFRQIVRVYAAMYEGCVHVPGEGPDDTAAVASPRFGMAWHRLEDLVLEGVFLQQRAAGWYAWISIGA